MTLVPFICFVIFFLLIVSLFRKDTDVFSPARIFSLVWSLAIGLSELKLSRFQKEWSPYSWLMLSFCVLATLVGMFVVYVINFNKPLPKKELIRESFKNLSVDSVLLFRIVLLLFFCYIISFIVTSIVQGYIPFFTFAPDATRSKWGIFGFGLFIQVVPALIYLMMLFFIIVKDQGIKKILIGIAFFVTLLTYFLILQRFYLIFCIILTVVFAYYATKKIKAKNVLIISILFIIIIYGISTVRTGRYLVNIVHYISAMKYSSKYALFTEPYMYVVMNLENFANAVDKLNVFDYGYNTFDFILALSGLKHWIHEYAAIKEFPFMITNSFNTYTMFFIFYKDFGVIGLGFFPFAFGLIVSAFYYHMRKKPSINTVSMYGIIVFVIVFSFFIPITSWLHFVFNVIIIYYVSKLVTMKTTPNELFVDKYS